MRLVVDFKSSITNKDLAVKEVESILTKQSSSLTILGCVIAFRMLISPSRFSSSLAVNFWRETALMAQGWCVFCFVSYTALWVS